MCVIILKKPGITLPFDKIKSACTVNPDGWGISILKPDNKMTTLKGFDPKGNDPEEIYKVIQDNNEFQQYIHLRFKTQGAVGLANCHPFNLVETDEYQSLLMHNGTLHFSKFDIPAGESDTIAFVNQYAAPTAEAFYSVSQKELLNNENFIRMMDHFITPSWYFMLYDNVGNYKILGGKGHWHDEDTWWSSNTYSFDSYHREPKNYSQGYRGYVPNYPPKAPSVTQFPSKTSGTVSESDIPKFLKDKTTNKKEETPFITSLKDDCKSIGYALIEAKRKGLKKSYHTPPEERPTFIDLAGLTKIEETFCLTEEEIFDIIEETPEAAALLIMDLIYALYNEDKAKNTKAA